MSKMITPKSRKDLILSAYYDQVDTLNQYKQRQVVLLGLLGLMVVSAVL